MYYSGQGQIVYSNMSYLYVARPKKVDGQGLVIALLKLGIYTRSADHCKCLVGVGTDGAAATLLLLGSKV